MANKVVVVIAGENQAQKVFREIHAGLGGIGQAGLNTSKILAGFTAALGLRELAQFARNLINVQDEAGKTAQKLGISTEFFTGLSYAAKISNVEAESLSTGLRFLSKNMADAAVRGSAAEAMFRRLGVSVKDAQGNLRPTDQVLLQIADRFAGMQDGAAKTALAIQIFGRAGNDLIPMLNEGSAGIEKFRAEAERLGLVIDDRTAAAADLLNDSLERMQGMARGAASQFLSGLIPPLADVADKFSQAASAGDNFRTSGEAVGEWARIAILTFVGMATTVHKLGLELAILNEEAKDFTPHGLLFGGADQGKIAQWRVEIQGLTRDYQTFLDAMSSASSGRTTTTPPPLAGGGAAAKPDFILDLTDTDLRTPAQLLTEIAKVLQLVNLAAGDTAGAEKFLAILGSPLPTGWPDELKAMETQIDLIFANMATKTEEIQGLVERGAISEIEGGQRVVDLHRQTGDALAALIPRYRELAALTGDPMLGAGVDALAARVKNLQKETNILGRHIREVFENQFADAVANIATGTQSISDAFKNMARAVIGELARIIAKLFIVWLLTKLLGGIFGAGGGGGVGSVAGLATNIGGKAQGGHFSAGEPFVAGEFGLPELIVPESAGVVVPNSQFSAMQGGGGDTFNIYAPGADIGVVQRLEALEDTLPQTVGASVRAIYEHARRR